MRKMSCLFVLLTYVLATLGLFVAESITQLPIHWQLNGKADTYISANWALLFPVVICTLLFNLPYLLTLIEPRRLHLAQSSRGLQTLLFGVIFFFAILELGYVLTLLDVDFEMAQLIVFGVGSLFIFMGNVLGKIRSNFFIGIRTPWTLSCDDIWRKTHRFAGKLVISAGVITVILAWLIQPQYTFFLVVFLVLPSLCIPVLYSWFLWLKEPQKSE